MLPLNECNLKILYIQMRIVVLIIFSSIFSSSFSHNRNVLYGERNLKENKLAVYMDKEGMIYPSYFISDSSLQIAHASLTEWYARNENDFLKISKSYKCKFLKYSLENCNILNDSILSAFNYKLNNIKGSYQPFAFLIHGFRKSFTEKNSDTPSPLAYKLLKDAIEKFHKRTTIYVEVYWDGMYDCCFTANTKNNKPLFKMFEDAQTNAALAGTTLKKIFNKLKNDTITIYAHSLGAKVAMYSLLNIDDGKTLTPSNKCINICLIAPAISPELITENYYKRNSYLDYQKNDNYHLYLIFNKKDFALRKKDNHLLLFGPGSTKYGNTSLGCNHKGAINTIQKHFEKNFKNSFLLAFDYTSIGKHHHLENYCESNLFQQTIEFMHM